MIIAVVGTLLVLVAFAVPIAATLGVLGLAIDQAFTTIPVHLALGEIAWQGSTQSLLVAVPMFILMGEIMLRVGIARSMYDAIARWLSWLPGGLMHSNIGSSALFASTSGSSVATAATIGVVALPQIARRGYNERLFLGSVAAGGTLGILIPPSINMIIYALLTETSVPKLYLAGFVPGFVLAALFVATIIAICMIRPDFAGERVMSSWRERFRSLPTLLPPLGIFLIVVGTIYAGVATPTEAAALGVVVVLGLAAVSRRLTLGHLIDALKGTMRTTAMVMLILVASGFLNFALGVIGFGESVSRVITGLGLSGLETILVIVLFYLVIGMFMETFSMLIMTAPIIVPIVVGAGYDPVWFGVLIMILLETAMITPPVGVILYVVQGIRSGGSMTDVMIGSVPFVAALLAMIGLMIAMPSIALWLPGLLT